MNSIHALLAIRSSDTISFRQSSFIIMALPVHYLFIGSTGLLKACTNVKMTYGLLMETPTFQ